MHSGIEDDALVVKELKLEIKNEEKSNYVSNENESNPLVPQVDLEKNTDQSQALSSCLKSRKSLETLIQNESDVNNKKSSHYKPLTKSKILNSDSNLVTNKPTGISKILTWDPWHKIGRNKSKKDKRKNHEKKGKLTTGDHITGDGPEPVVTEKKPDEDIEENSCYDTEISETVEDDFEDNLKPVPEKVIKVVRFLDNVEVVYYADDEILGQTIEPLKKELEQQERNKELRKEFSPETGLGLRQSLKKSASDYMAAWYKK